MMKTHRGIIIQQSIRANGEIVYNVGFHQCQVSGDEFQAFHLLHEVAILRSLFRLIEMFFHAYKRGVCLTDELRAYGSSVRLM